MTTVARKPHRGADPAAVPGDVALALALAVAAPGSRARPIDAGNRGGPTLPIAQAVASGQAFAVRVRSGVLAVDLDGEGPVPAAEAAAKLAAWLAGRGVRAVIVASGGEGRRHLFAAVADPGTRAAAADVAREVGGARGVVREGARLIRPPGAPHRSGLIPRPVAPGTWAGVLAVLTPPAGPPGAERGAANGRPRGLPAWARDLLAAAPDEGARSEACWRVTLCMARRGWGEELAWRTLAGAPLGARVADRGRGWFGGEWARAQAAVTAPPPRDPAALRAIAAIREAADRHEWRAPTDPLILAAVLDIAEATGSLDVSASTRQLAEAVNVAECTARASLRRLRDARRGAWLAVVTVGRGRAASVHRLLLPREPVPPDGQEQRTKTRPPSPLVRCFLHDPLPGHDAFAGREGLGKGVARTLGAIVAEPGATVARLAARPAHPTARTLTRHVRVLRDAGLIVAAGEGWEAVAPALLAARLDALAADLGTAGARRARVALHDRQRRAYAVRRARLRAAHGDGKAAP